MVLVAALAVLGLTLTAVPAMAGKSGPNNANAKLCQKNGWASLYTSTGGTFTSEKACTSYAAGGGTLLTAPPLNGYQQTCLTLLNGVSTTLSPKQFLCDAGGDVGDRNANIDAFLSADDSLYYACQALGATYTGEGQADEEGWIIHVTCPLP